MASYEQLMDGARRADAAGDQAGARRFLELAVEAKRAAAPEQAPALTGAEAMRARGLKSPDPSQANASAEGAMLDAAAKRFVEDNPALSRLSSTAAGVPFIGGWVDEGIDAVGNAIGVKGGGERVRQAQAAMARAHPMQDAALRLAGGVLGSLPAVGLAPYLGAAMPNALAAQTAMGAATGAGAGALEGAVNGAGAAGEGNRLAGAESGALIGGSMGGLVGAAAPIVGAGVNSLARYLKGTDTAAVRNALSVSPEAARAIQAALDGEDFAKAAQNIQRGGADAMLVEGGPSLQALGDAVGNSGGGATRIMREAVAGRTEKAAGQMAGVLDNALGQAAGRTDLASSIRSGTANARKAAYDAAYAAPIDYSSAAGRRVEDVLSRAPARTVDAAIRQANERMAYDGIQGQIMASVGPDGKVAFQEMPNAMQLDYIKRGFDQIAEDGTDKLTGKMTGDAAFAARVAKDVRNAHAAANPEYRQALRTGMDSIQGEKAVETGYKALMAQTSREGLLKEVRGMNPAQRATAKLGVRQYLDDQMANVRAVMSRQGTDAGEAIKGLKEISSRASRDKLRTLLGATDADALIGEADRLTTAFEIQAAMAQNSKTAVRQAVQGSVQQSAAPGPVGRLMAGEPIQAGKRLAQIFTGASPEAVAAREAGILEEIATALTQTKGPDAQRALLGVQRAIAGQPLNDAQARRISHLVTTTLAGGGYQLGRQELQSQLPR